jgi:hypothetical protein
MTKMQNWIYRSAGLLLLSLLSACATSYSAKSINAHVVDAESRQPMEGVVVVVHWIVKFGLEGGGGTDMKLMETVTDGDGNFFFPAWGPESIPSGLPLEARLKGQDPEIILYKKGYFPVGLSNDRPTSGQAGSGPSVRTSDWGGKTIPMKKFIGERRVYGAMLDSMLTGVNYGGCNFNKIPRLLSAVISEQAELRRQRVHYSFFTLEGIQSLTNGHCGSVEQSLSEYLKNEEQ